MALHGKSPIFKGLFCYIYIAKLKCKMIKFEPKITLHSGGLMNIDLAGENYINKQVSARLNEAVSGNSCATHPDFENIIEVNYRSLGDNRINIGSIKACCCDDFRSKLELLVQNKNPFQKD